MLEVMDLILMTKKRQIAQYLLTIIKKIIQLIQYNTKINLLIPKQYLQIQKNMQN